MSERRPDIAELRSRLAAMRFLDLTDLRSRLSRGYFDALFSIGMPLECIPTGVIRFIDRELRCRLEATE